MPIQLLAQLEQGLQLVDKASTASDRWLFLAAIVFIIIAFLIVVRYLVQDRDKERNARMEENANRQKWIVEVYTENMKMTASILVVLQETNSLLKRLEGRLNHHEEN